ncbi:cytochrome P450 [Novosphingobium album (ex Hu et al. 2023)]|uniref:Cytochrome P450 n=1 Tax=Novosphingobium album (ex Hu et al. 2023) TaxID=2930093 RepID=A0ABT0B5B7_9SPHN|nr:cytochrome P450 [Novosphingobium album (ex Hu et al. 2023)]MCJ2180262.1 cytochrome P450 [Novosphingobium album (ex Hu et al. 2023)]
MITDNVAERDFFTDTTLVQEPHPWVEALRAQGPLVREHHHNSIVLTGYDEVQDVYSRPEDFSNVVCVGGPLGGVPFTPQGDDICAAIEANRDKFVFSEHFITFDGEAHRVHRALLTKLLTFKRLKANEAFMDSYAGELIEAFAARRSCELVSEFSQPLATMVIADLLGVPEEDREELRAKVLPAPGGADQGEGAVFVDPLAVFTEVFTDYLKDRRAHPRDDLLTELVNSRLPDGSDPGIDTMVRLACFLFIGGQDTSAKLLASAVRILAERPGIQQALRADRNLIGNFIEETLRFESPTMNDFRLARRTTTVGGVEVKAGTIITLSLTGANRDPDYFENPNEFDMNRPKVRDHLAFGRGPHGCLGAPLARLEARTGLNRLLDAFPVIEIDEEHHGPAGARHYNYLPSYILRGLEDLYLRFP